MMLKNFSLVIKSGLLFLLVYW